MQVNDKVDYILREFEILYPNAVCSLDNDGVPFHLFVRAILSAQCTDKRVNEVTKTLLVEYPDPEAFAAETEIELEKKIKSCGLYRAKAHSLIASSQMLIRDFDHMLPADQKRLSFFLE